MNMVKIPVAVKSTWVTESIATLGTLLAITFTALGEVLVPMQAIFLDEISF